MLSTVLAEWNAKLHALALIRDGIITEFEYDVAWRRFRTLNLNRLSAERN